MTTEEAIKYLIIPTATSTKPSAEYLKQKEAYELAIKALGERPQGFWAEFEGGYRCSNCDDVEVYTPNFCPNCGAKMQKGGTE